VLEVELSGPILSEPSRTLSKVNVGFEKHFYFNYRKFFYIPR
jgi:hypothetical protein